MRFETVLIHSRVARRVYLLFILSAIVPITALAVISFTHVSNQLYDQSQKRLRQASKAAGMAIYERLMLLDAEFDVVTARAATPREPSSFPKPFDDELTKRFSALTLVKPDQDPVRYFGASHVNSLPSPDQWRHVRSGKSLLMTQLHLDGVLGLLLGKAISSDTEDALWLAEINAQFLWGGEKENILPPLMDMCVLSSSLDPLFCTAEKPQLPAQHRLRKLEESGKPYFEWQAAGRVYLGSFWSLPLRHRFDASAWIIVVSEAKDDMLGPMEGFKYTFTLVMVLALAFVSWLTLRQVHSSLIPLERLQEGTRRIAQRDFTSRVRVTSGDEFEELANSFNSMAERLGRQFQMLQTMAAISQSILSTFEAQELVGVVQSRAREALPCDSIGVTLLKGDRAGTATMSIRYFVNDGGTAHDSIILTDDDLDTLRRHPHHLVATGNSVPAYLGSLQQKTLVAFVILPILLRDTCSGFIVLGYQTAFIPSLEDIAYARQLTDQVCIALSNAHEISRRLQADAKAYFLAHYDPLTRLANRQRFHDRISDAFEKAKDTNTKGTVFLINLDRFQRINDTFGPQAGDVLLKDVAARLGRCVKTISDRHQDRDADGNGNTSTIARLDGDRFGILLSISALEESVAVARQLFESLNKPYQVCDTSMTVTASMGIGFLGLDGSDTDTLLRNADTALAAAKETGGNTYQFFAPSMNISLANRILLERQLRLALERHEFHLYYQPQVDVISGNLVGVEALIRWQHPERGFVSPAEFIPIAEAENLITPIGEWVFREACVQQQRWHKLGLSSLDIAINVSSLQFQQQDFVHRITGILEETSANPRRLELELTESVLMNDSGSAIATLKQLKAMGFRLAMDDFGTGYSSLAYLNRFPLDTLKIDRAFVDQITLKSEGLAIAGAIIAMGQALKLHVLAEGVETEEQLAFLRARRCNSYQGYLYSRPLPAEDITPLLLTHMRANLAKPA